VEGVGGEMGGEGEEGAGGIFGVGLALERAHGPLAPAVETSVTVITPLRILLAEDHPVNRQVALGLLARHGHSVDVVADGAAAVEAARGSGYDVILMDVHMPVLDGIEASRIIRSFPGAAGRVPIVGLGASVLKAEPDLCFAAGMDEFLAKPIDPAALTRVLAHHAPPAAAAAPTAPAVETLLDTAYLSALVDALGTARVAALAE